jgi:hypothetical protein
MEKIDILFAIEEIRQLKSRYFRFLDTKEWDSLATIFTEDAIFDARAANSVNGIGDDGRAAESNEWVYEGGRAIVDFIAAVAQPFPSVHHGSGHEIEILSEDEARGVIAMEDRIWDVTGDAGQSRLHGFGHYHEEYRRRDGVWRIWRSKLTRLNVRLA